MDNKYLPIPIANLIYNFVQILYISVLNLTDLQSILTKCVKFWLLIYVLLLPLANTYILADIAETDSWYWIIGATLVMTHHSA